MGRRGLALGCSCWVSAVHPPSSGAGVEAQGAGIRVPETAARGCLLQDRGGARGGGAGAGSLSDHVGPHAPQRSRSFQLKRLPAGGSVCRRTHTPSLHHRPVQDASAPKTPRGDAQLPPGVCQGGPQSVLQTHRARTQGPGGSFYSDCKASLSMRRLKTNLIYFRPCWLFGCRLFSRCGQPHVGSVTAVPGSEPQAL